MENGYKPKIIFVKDLGMFVCGMIFKEAETALMVMQDHQSGCLCRKLWWSISDARISD